LNLKIQLLKDKIKNNFFIMNNYLNLKNQLLKDKIKKM